MLAAAGNRTLEQRSPIAHAEMLAIGAACAAVGSERLTGCDIYVTLEPCSHHGRTAPCADALIAAGIGRVVVATVDPNPLVRGSGLAKLRAAGIAVTLGVCEAEARALNNAFAFSVQHGRPWVTLKSAVSADGKLAPPPSARSPGQLFWLTGPAARADVQTLRHAADVLLTGIGTVLADDPALTDRTGLPRRRPLLRVVLDSHLRTPLGSRLVTGSDDDLLLLASEDVPAGRRRALEASGAEILPLPAHNGRLSLRAVLDVLHQRGHVRVLLEAGSLLNGAALAQDLVDEAVLYIAPVELGPAALPFAHGADTLHKLEHRLIHTAHQQIGLDLRLTGLLHDPWSDIPSNAPPSASP